MRVLESIFLIGSSFIELRHGLCYIYMRYLLCIAPMCAYIILLKNVT